MQKMRFSGGNSSPYLKVNDRKTNGISRALSWRSVYDVDIYTYQMHKNAHNPFTTERKCIIISKVSS